MTWSSRTAGSSTERAGRHSSGDVAIQDGKIAAVGEVERRGRRAPSTPTVRCVAPGFIDAHTHYDAQLLWDPTANPSTVHGITTVLMGNCGYTLAPVRVRGPGLPDGPVRGRRGDPEGGAAAFAPFGWETFPEYLDWIEGRIGINVVTQVGHSAVRRFVMGEAALERAATDDEIAEMVRIVEEAMDAGAAGVSSSHAPHQRGELGRAHPVVLSPTAEILALAEAVQRKGRQLLSINPATKRDGLSDEDRASPGGARRTSRAPSCRGTTSAWARPTATARSSSWRSSSRRVTGSTRSPAASAPSRASR